MKILNVPFREVWNRTRRGVLYALLLLVGLLLQNVILSHIPILGVRVMFLPVLVVAVGLFEGGIRGGYFGLAAGALCDLLLSSQGVLFTVLFPVYGFVSGFLVDFYLNRRLFSYSVMAVGALLLAGLAQMLNLALHTGQYSWAMWRTVLLQTLWSAPFLFPAYYVCRLIPRKTGEKIPSPYSAP